MKIEIIRIIGALIILIAFSYFVYPTPFYYTQFGSESTSKVPVKINRLTNDAYMLGSSGWVKMESKK